MSILRSQLAGLALLLALAAVLAFGWLSWTDRVAAQQAGKKQKAASGPVERPGPSIAATDLPTMKALDSHMHISYKDIPMQLVLEDVEHKCKGALTIVVDEQGLKEAMVEPAAFLNDIVSKVFRQPLKVRVFLRMILAERGMGYYFKDGVLYVTKDAKALKKMVVKAYPVSNLLGGQQLVNAAIREAQYFEPKPKGPPLGPNGTLLSQNFDSLTALIRGSVEPEYWTVSNPGNPNAPGSMAFVPSNSTLQVRASLEVQYLLIASDLLDNNQNIPADPFAEPDPKAVTVKTYNIAGLIDPKNLERSKSELLSAVSLAAAMGKDGEQAPSPASMVVLGHSELLVVRQTLEIHQRIDRLLAQLKAARPIPPRTIWPFAGDTPNGGKGIAFGNNGGGGLFGTSSGGVFGTPAPAAGSVPAAGGGFLGDVK